MSDHLNSLLAHLQESLAQNTFVKLTLGGPRGGSERPRQVIVRLLTLKRGDQLGFVERHDTKDVTRTLSITDGLTHLQSLLSEDYQTANLLTTTKNVELEQREGRPTRLRVAEPTHLVAPSRDHNRAKRHPISALGNQYLELLGVTAKDGTVKKGMEPKFKQINKFVEILAGLIGSSSVNKADEITIVDMGSGKGYLTFALYEYLTQTLQKGAQITGVEARPELVDLCNQAASSCGFGGLRFECGNITDFAVGRADVVIALHACDTATDEAIFKAIEAEADIIVCAPCCHKELRPKMRQIPPVMQGVLEHGILMQRQAELLTDGMRALLLEAFGHKTSVFEFIATEHTSKNLMIAGIKKGRPADQNKLLARVDALMEAYGIGSQRLEELLRTAN